MPFNSTASSQTLATPAQLHGVTGLAVAGLLSVVCVAGLLLSFLFSTIRSYKKSDNAVSGLQRFLRGGLGLYLVSTLVADGILGAAYAMSFHWVAERRIYDSPACQAQAVLIQLSDFSTGLSTLALSLHTFLVLVPMRPPRRRVAVVLIPLFWVVSALTACIGPLAVERNGVPFYGVAGKWCYIREEYAAWRFILLYDLIWTVMVASTVVYIWIFLSLAGVVRTRSRLTSASGGGNASRTHESRMNHSTSRKMLAYPLLYLLVFLPVSVTRILNLRRQTVPLWLVIFAGTCLASSGTINTILFVCTRWALLSNISKKAALTDVGASGVLTSGSEVPACTSPTRLSRPAPGPRQTSTTKPRPVRPEDFSPLPCSDADSAVVLTKGFRHGSADSGWSAAKQERAGGPDDGEVKLAGDVHALEQPLDDCDESRQGWVRPTSVDGARLAADA